MVKRTEVQEDQSTTAAGNSYRVQETAGPDYSSNLDKNECNDVFFLLVFLGVFVMTIYFAASYGATFVAATQVSNVTESTGFKLIIKYAAYSGLASIGLSLLWIVTMIFMGEFLIWMTLILIITANVCAAIFMTKQLHDRNDKYYWWPAVVFGTIALLVILYAICIRVSPISTFSQLIFKFY